MYRYLIVWSETCFKRLGAKNYFLDSPNEYFTEKDYDKVKKDIESKIEQKIVIENVISLGEKK